jgi:Protein of unknown function (DUF4238)
LFWGISPERQVRRKKVISVRDLTTGKTFQAALTRVAASNRFYDFATESNERLSIDPFLTDIESATAPAWRKLAQTECIRELDGQDREALAVFMSLSLFVDRRYARRSRRYQTCF